eukprot:6124430-Pleurochrysis_carterae.AAC.1
MPCACTRSPCERHVHLSTCIRSLPSRPRVLASLTVGVLCTASCRRHAEGADGDAGRGGGRVGARAAVDASDARALAKGQVTDERLGATRAAQRGTRRRRRRDSAHSG